MPNDDLATVGARSLWGMILVQLSTIEHQFVLFKKWQIISVRKIMTENKYQRIYMFRCIFDMLYEMSTPHLTVWPALDSYRELTSVGVQISPFSLTPVIRPLRD